MRFAISTMLPVRMNAIIIIKFLIIIIIVFLFVFLSHFFAILDQSL